MALSMGMPVQRCLVVLAAGALLACTVTRRRAGPRAYAQYAEDSISAHCRTHPELCAYALAPESGSAIQAVATGTLAATVVVGTVLSATEKGKIEEVLKRCADQARSEVLIQQFGGKDPTASQCNEVIGTGDRGEPIYRSMKLGDDMHRAAYDCLKENLGKLYPGRFSIEQRYRYDPRTGRTTVVTDEEETAIRRDQRFADLRGTIVPDVVIHNGDPRFAQGVYDFKFPCADVRKVPEWRRYPAGHPFSDLNQREIYEGAFRLTPRRVTPGGGLHP